MNDLDLAEYLIALTYIFDATQSVDVLDEMIMVEGILNDQCNTDDDIGVQPILGVSQMV